MFKGLSDNLLLSNNSEANSSLQQTAARSDQSATAKQQSLPAAGSMTAHTRQDPPPVSPTTATRSQAQFSSGGNSSSSMDNKALINGDDIQSSNLPIRVILLLLDEVFDLKEKNQWLRQSLMSIVKSFVKNFKGDSMNRKIKDQIAELMGEEYIARYLKNFRKRLWPKGYMIENAIERPKCDKEVTKILVKTKLLPLISGKRLI